jgi:prepilin-type N-terminal cleavage/methylation domain-containing protein
MKGSVSQGFTLIELLVVIAIIGILSAVVLASLSDARSKGNDSATQSDMSTIRTQAEIFYGGIGSYGPPPVINTGNCPLPTSPGTSVFGDTVVMRAITSIRARNGNVTASVSCNHNGSAYAIQAQLSGTNRYWCVDSTGAAFLRSSTLGAGPTQCL